MSAKRLFPLVALFIIVVIVGVVLKRRPAPIQLADETGFERLVPQSLSVDAIRGVDLALGTQSEHVVRLRRQDSGWVAASYHQAPVHPDKLTSFLTTLSGLEGEFRTEQPELLQDYQLDDAQALHLRLYTDNLEAPAVHLLAGKGSGRASFMRRADSPRVYSVNLNVHNEAGLSGNAPDAQLTAKPWLDLRVQDVPKEQITAVALQTPERTLHFTWQPDPPATTASQETTPPAAAAAQGGHWVLTTPPALYAPKQSGLEGLVNAIRTLRADDIANPDHAADYGLSQSSYRIVLTVQAPEQAPRDIVLLVGESVPEQAGKRYSRLGAEGPIYILPAWVFRRLFPPAKDVLDLPRLDFQPADVQRLTWQQGEEAWTLEPHTASGETPPSPLTWRLQERPEVTLDETAVQALFKALLELSADDWVEHPGQPTGLDQPQVTLRLTLRDQRLIFIALGHSRGSSDAGYYAKLLDSPGTFVVPSTTYTALTEALKPLHPAQPAAPPLPTKQ